MKRYISTKILKAEEMSKNTFLMKFKDIQNFKTDQDGYHIQYPTNNENFYDYWCSKEDFESSYCLLTDVQVDVPVDFAKAIKEVL